jgi:hypothetical protein
MSENNPFRNPFREIMSAIPDHRPGITLTRGQLEAWAGAELTDENVEELEQAIPNSSIPESIAVIAESIFHRDG